MRKKHITPETQVIIILNGQLLDETFTDSGNTGYSGELDAKHNIDDEGTEEIQFNIWDDNPHSP